MRVLVVDDDRTTRFLLRRALITEFGCTVIDAGDGVEALEALAAARYQLMILDVQMPIMDGLETLRALRDAPEYRQLPVVMLTAERSEAIVQQIIALGVLDYMTKPLVPERIVERLRRVTRWLQTENDLVPDRSPLEGHGLDPGTSLLVVDGSEDFRRFVTDTLGARYAVRQADTGARGFRECLESKPGAVLIGAGLGVLSESVLVRKIRLTPATRDVYLVAVVDKEEDAAARTLGYDGRITRTFVAEAFQKQFDALASAHAGPLRELLAIHPGLRVSLISAAEQVFGMMLLTEVALREASPLVPADRVTVAASAHFSSQSVVELRGCFDLATGRHMAAALLGVNPSAVGDEDVDEAACEVLTMITARLQNSLADKQVPVQFGVPSVSRSTSSVGRVEGDILLCFQSSSREVSFWLRLSVRAGAEAGEMSAQAVQASVSRAGGQGAGVSQEPGAHVREPEPERPSPP